MVLKQTSCCKSWLQNSPLTPSGQGMAHYIVLEFRWYTFFTPVRITYDNLNTCSAFLRRPQKLAQYSWGFGHLLSKRPNHKDDCANFCGLFRKAELYLITVHFTLVYLRLQSARSTSLPFGHRSTVDMLLKTCRIYMIFTGFLVRPQHLRHLKRLRRTPAKVC